MPEELQKENRLGKRLWLLNNFDHVLQESVYYRTHKENFNLSSIILWSWNQDESRAKITYVD